MIAETAPNAIPVTCSLPEARYSMALVIARPDDSICDALGRHLLTWFAHSARDLPWRRERTPYRVWVAEVMLQQTRVETVVPYYGRFLARFPTVQTLAQSPLEEVLKVWEIHDKRPLRILISDPHIMGHFRKVDRLCDLLIEADLDITFQVMSRTDSIVKQPAIVEKMIRAGMIRYFIAVLNMQHSYFRAPGGHDYFLALNVNIHGGMEKPVELGFVGIVAGNFIFHCYFPVAQPDLSAVLNIPLYAAIAIMARPNFN